MGTRRACGQGPGSVQETDTRARSGSGGYPARGSSAILYYGLERSRQLRRRPPARHRNCAPPAPPASTDPGKNPGRPRPETRQRRKGNQFSSHHGRAAKRRMYSFTEIADPQGLARVADAWPRDAAIGRLGQVCDRWIYSACLCFGLDLEEQVHTDGIRADPEPPFDTPPTMIVRLVADIQNRLFWRVGTGRASECCVPCGMEPGVTRWAAALAERGLAMVRDVGAEHDPAAQHQLAEAISADWFPQPEPFRPGIFDRQRLPRRLARRSIPGGSTGAGPCGPCALMSGPPPRQTASP